MGVGCEKQFNQGICQVVLLQNFCTMTHGPDADNDATAACAKIWPGELKKTPNQMYCKAAAGDPELWAVSQRLRQLVEIDCAMCNVKKLSHLQGDKIALENS